MAVLLRILTLTCFVLAKQTQTPRGLSRSRREIRETLKKKKTCKFVTTKRKEKRNKKEETRRNYNEVATGIPRKKIYSFLVLI